MISPVYIGLMSGTSCDGFDLVALDATELIIKQQQSFAYTNAIRQRLLQLAVISHPSIIELAQLDQTLADLYTQALQGFITQLNQPVAAIGLHGPTIRHGANLNPAFSWQIGCATKLANQLNLPVVHQMRQTDICLGGQGAPLAPVFHQALLQRYLPQQTNLVINLGGIANITVCNQQTLIGFDTGPANTLMDAWVRQHQLDPKGFDDFGKLASLGTVSKHHLQACLEDCYFQQSLPKSTGREHFNLDWLGHCWQSLPKLSNCDTLATLVQLTVESILTGIKQVNSYFKRQQTYPFFLIGGGVNNQHLKRQLSQAINAQWPQLQYTDFPCHHQYVEAAAWAYLAYLQQKRKAINLQQLTGNKSAGCILGQMVLPAV